MTGRIHIPVDRAKRARPRRAAAVVEEIAQAEADDTGDDVEVFDPSLHNIDGVLAYLDEHPDALVAVADLERAAAKPRSTLLAELEARIEAATAPDTEGDTVEGHTDDDTNDDPVDDDTVEAGDVVKVED